jgi:succinate dehydrogenase/fumarate reductase flavoprotein subunit
LAAQRKADNVIETDVLVMGGGLGGCPAACKAAEHGLRVTIVEKAATERSGACAMGRDEIQPFTREGVTALELVRRMRDARGEIGKLQDPNVLYKIVDNSMWTLEELERLGISMRYFNGEYHWTNFMSFGTGANLSLQVPWLNVKPEMAAAMKKRGVNVLDRTMVLDLLTNKGKVVGGTAVNTRTGEFIVIKAKAVVIAAGKYLRHCNPSTSTWKYKMGYDMNPSSGDGQAAAYRAGSDISSMELMISDGYPDELCLA